ncbi:MAG: response regulator transcription factor [Pseudomonadales bacterium]|nr:response regulator transcription factor [Pseudomonadales bacterium]
MHTVLIADDHMLIRDSLRQLIESLEGFTVVDDVDNGFDALVAIKKLQPSLILLDVAMPDASGIEVVIDTQRWSPDTKIIIYTGVTSGTRLKQLLDCGVDGLFFKHSDTRYLRDGINAVAEGRTAFDDKLADIIAGLEAADNLTAREKQVLSQILSGHSTRDIASYLNISVKTVDNHRTHIMRKLGTHSVSDLMRLAINTGLIDLDAP